MPIAETKPHWLVTEEKVDAVVARLAELARPSRIIVFGSAATGKLHRDSDLDLLVIMPEEVKNCRAESGRLKDMVRDIDMSKDIFVISEAEAAAAVNNRYGILGPALREGRLAYQAPR
jgi:uncharacterized protein